MAARSTSRAVAPALVFQSIEFHPVARKGLVWLKSAELAQALGFADEKAVNRIYARHADEFTSCMTLGVKLTPNGFANGAVVKETRVFSLRGAHLVAMFARTPTAKAFRRWVLDVLDQQAGAPTAPRIDELETVNEIVTRLASQVEQPNAYPLHLFTPLVEAVQRRSAHLQRRRDADLAANLQAMANQVEVQAQQLKLLAAGAKSLVQSSMQPPPSSSQRAGVHTRCIGGAR